MQRLTVAEGSFKDIERRVHLCLRSISVLRSISQKNSSRWERDRTTQVEATPNRTTSHVSGVTPSTLDRDEQMLQSLLMSCQHSGDWAAQYSKRVNIQIQLVRTPLSPFLLPLREFLDSYLATQKFNLLTSRIASEAQRDSSAMITIAVLTMFFLPATFVCVGLSVALPPPPCPPAC